MKRYNLHQDPSTWTVRKWIYHIITYRMVILNPPHTKAFVPGIGKMESEFDFCEKIIEMLLLACANGFPIHEFADPLIRYIRWKEKQNA